MQAHTAFNPLNEGVIMDAEGLQLLALQRMVGEAAAVYSERIRIRTAELMTACKAGDLGAVQGLVPHMPSGAWGRHILTDAFVHACNHGRLAVVQWLAAGGHGRAVDVHVDGDMRLKCACSHGHLAVAKWLVSLGTVDIHCFADAPFWLACEYGHWGLARWLLTLEPDETYKWPRMHHLKKWSAPRDAWMRSVCWGRPHI